MQETKIVKCICNNNNAYKLIIGKLYLVFKEDDDNGLYEITNDLGDNSTYLKHRFIEVTDKKQIRTFKLLYGK